MAAPSQKRALGALFLILALVIAGISFAAGDAGQWPITVAAAAISIWLFALAFRGLRP